MWMSMSPLQPVSAMHSLESDDVRLSDEGPSKQQRVRQQVHKAMADDQD